MKSFAERLREESEVWVGEGIINPEQARLLTERYPLGLSTHNRFIAILATIGGAIVLTGICLIISANWREIGDWTKIFTLVGLLLGAYWGGYHLKLSPGMYPRIGDMCFMVGSGLFLCGIALVSQIFHLNDRPANGVLVWMLGIVPIGWLVRSKGAHFLSILAFLVWFGMEVTSRDSLVWIGEGRPFALVSLYTLFGVALWLVGLLGGRGNWAFFAPIHENLGISLSCFGLYSLGFYRHYSDYSYRTLEKTHAAAVLTAVLFLGLLALTRVAWRQKPEEIRLLGPWLALMVFPVLMIGWGVDLQDHGWLWSCCAWFVLLVLNIMMLRIGGQTGRPSWINFSILLIAANILTRYFDLFASMLDGGLFFIVTGSVIIALCFYLERKRRGLLASLGSSPAALNTEGGQHE